MSEWNKNERQLIRGLDALAVGHREQAPPAVKERLQEEFRRHAHRVRSQRRIRWAGMAAGVAAMAILLPLLRTHERLAGPVYAPRSVTLVAAPQSAQLAPAVVKRTARKRRVARRDLTAFIALDDGPVGAGLVVRVKIPRSTLGDGTGVGEVEADVLLGEDGLAHAVRFVR